MSRGRPAVAGERAALGWLGWAVAGLAVSNVVSNRVVGQVAYVPWNLAAAGALLGLARLGGADAAEVGLDRAHLRRGLRAGALAGAVVVAGSAALAAGDRTRPLFDDARVAGTRSLAWAVLVRIPLGTVVLEEVAFRGVLPALVRRATRRRWASAAVPAALFGLWHVLPALDTAKLNAALRQAVGDRPAATAVLAVVSMTAIGGLLQLVRAGGRHLAAPALAHAATNTVTFSIAWWLGRRRRV